VVEWSPASARSDAPPPHGIGSAWTSLRIKPEKRPWQNFRPGAIQDTFFEGELRGRQMEAELIKWMWVHPTPEGVNTVFGRGALDQGWEPACSALTGVASLPIRFEKTLSRVEPPPVERSLRHN